MYSCANDTLNNWKNNKLETQESFWSFNYKLDSLLCFNKTKNRMVGCLLIQCDKPTCLQEDLHFFYGAKINEKWFFFKGADVTLPRNMYQDNLHTPLSFAKLHEIALKEIYSGYLTKDGEINEAWFDYHFYNVGLCGDCKTPKEFEKAYLRNIANNWYGAKKDTANKVLP